MPGVDVWFFVIGSMVMTESPNMPNLVGPMTEKQCTELAARFGKLADEDEPKGTCQHAVAKRECPLSDEDLKKFTACPVWVFEKK